VLQSLVVGVIVGGIYGLYALGLVLVFKGTRVLNFAQAEIGLFTLFIAQILIVEHHQPYVVGAAVAIVLAIALGLAFERFAVRPLAGQSPVTIAVATVGLLTLLITMEITLFGGLPRLLPPAITGHDVQVAGVHVSAAQLLSLVVVPSIALALGAFLRFTDFGLGVLAYSSDPEAVRIMGIRATRVSAFTWATAAGLSAVAALLIQPTVGTVSPNAFGGIFVSAVAAALIGGLTSLPGAFVGGLVVGIVESQVKHATVGAELPGMANLVIFAGILAVLLLRPNGLVTRS
jgi:branched-chain amino acid transport system permease protein